jgi:hypothetical protein
MLQHNIPQALPKSRLLIRMATTAIITTGRNVIIKPNAIHNAPSGHITVSKK